MKLFLALMGAVLAGCQSPTQPTGNQARADLEARNRSKVAGYVEFVERPGKVLVSVNVTGLKPNSVHGFHIHEIGDCSAPDALSAGGHFNPDGHPHGNPQQKNRHAGAMVNLVADGKGEATVVLEVDTIRLDNRKYGVLGRSLIIHANPDDYASQPVGNAGGRIACGLIRKV
jgi:superoxide dismutase, Cu-Zn family